MSQGGKREGAGRPPTPLRLAILAMEPASTYCTDIAADPAAAARLDGMVRGCNKNADRDGVDARWRYYTREGKLWVRRVS